MTASARISVHFPPVGRLGSASDYLSSFPEIVRSRVTFFVRILLPWNVFVYDGFGLKATITIQEASGSEVE